jgi:hypothetical protein
VRADSLFYLLALDGLLIIQLKAAVTGSFIDLSPGKLRDELCLGQGKPDDVLQYNSNGQIPPEFVIQKISSALV